MMVKLKALAVTFGRNHHAGSRFIGQLVSRDFQRRSMAISIVLAVFLYCGTALGQNVQWAKRAGGTDEDYGYGVAVDGLGNSYVTGSFFGTTTFGLGEANETTLNSPGNYDMFVAKFDSSGALLWAKQAGGVNSSAEGFGLAVDGSGNSHVTGYFDGTATFGPGQNLKAAGNYDLFVAKYNSSGALQWAKRAGGVGSSTDAYSIAVDGSGNSYVTGSFDATATFGPNEINETSLTAVGVYDTFVAKYNSSGALQWAKRAGGVGSAADGFGIAADSSGNSYVTGSFDASSGNSYVTGSFDATATYGLGEVNETSLTALGLWDIVVAKYDSNGALLWAKRAGGLGSAADGERNKPHLAGRL